MKSKLSNTVWILGAASLLTDLSAEMIYPLLPVFLTTVMGAGIIQLAWIEGVAEATASIVQVFSGSLADQLKVRKPLIVLGYGISGFCRPFIGLAGSWGAVLGLRFSDRVGKGLRTAPRDSLIAEVTPLSLHGRAYGIHRAMDHAGAVGGPLVASALLLGLGMELREVFFWAAVPAFLTVLVLFFGIREAKYKPAPTRAPLFATWKSDWQSLGPEFKGVLFAVSLYALGCSTDAFLLLRLTQAGVSPAHTAMLWALHSSVKMMATAVGGRVCDRIGSRRSLITGWCLYALAYFGLAFAESATVLVALFMAYGVCFGLIEPAERALVAASAPAHLRSTAFGIFHFSVGIALLPASVLFGWIWQASGAKTAFLVGALFPLIGAVVLFARTPRSISNVQPG